MAANQPEYGRSFREVAREATSRSTCFISFRRVARRYLPMLIDLVEMNNLRAVSSKL